jgi:ribose/xylose/arabinose/galactoside ABC-type transport system permease subunit
MFLSANKKATLDGKKNHKKSISSVMVLFITMIIMFVVFSFSSEFFFTINNIINLLQQVAVLGIASAGITLVILSGSLDLSTGAIMAVSGIYSAWFLELGAVWYVALLGGILVGTLCGVINASMINILKMNPLIVTLGMANVWEGVTKLRNNGVAIGVFDASFKFIGQGRIFGIPVVIYIMLATYLIMILVMKYTIFGREAYAVGGNAKAALYSGINIKKTRFMIYSFAGAFAGLAGVAYAAIVGSGTVTAGSATTLNAIAAVVLGGASLAGGVGSMTGTFIGVVLLGTIDNGLSILAVSTFWQLIVKGVILLIAVYIDVARGGEAYE